MAKLIYDYDDYKNYLFARAGGKGSRNGIRTGLALAAACNTAYISQVLYGSTHLSLEQAEKINAFLSHSEEESHYFLLLVEHARAGTAGLKKHFELQINRIKEQRLNIQKRLGIKKMLSPADQAKYYSVWYFAAIHVALSMPAMNRPEAIASYLDLPVKKVRKVLEFLISVGLAIENSGSYSIGQAHLHLGNDAECIVRHHTNWRLKALETIPDESAEAVHYASAVTLSKKDVFRIKDLLVENIKQVNQVVEQSKEETLFCYVADFFPLNRRPN